MIKIERKKSTTRHLQRILPLKRLCCRSSVLSGATVFSPFRKASPMCAWRVNLLKSWNTYQRKHYQDQNQCLAHLPLWVIFNTNNVHLPSRVVCSANNVIIVSKLRLQLPRRFVRWLRRNHQSYEIVGVPTFLPFVPHAFPPVGHLGVCCQVFDILSHCDGSMLYYSLRNLMEAGIRPSNNSCHFPRDDETWNYISTFNHQTRPP